MAGYKDFSDGEYFTGDLVDGYLMRQSVMRFSTTTDMMTQLGAGIRVAGMVGWADDTQTWYSYQGSGVWMPIDSYWKSYTPVWSAPTALVIGNGSITGRWKYSGGLVFVHIELTRGSTTNTGSGNYSWSLPVEAKTSKAPIGSAFARDDTPFAEYPGIVMGISSTSVAVLASHAANSRWSNTTPIATPATADVYNLTFSYEPLNGISL